MVVGTFHIVTPRPGPEEVVALAEGLLEKPTRWGLLGVEYLFFHQFFHPELQENLQSLRRELYGHDTPPMPLGLTEALAWMANFALALEEKWAVEAMEWLLKTVAKQRWRNPQKAREVAQFLANDNLRAAWENARTKATFLPILLTPFTDGDEGEQRIATAGSVSQRLEEFEERLPAAPGTLHLSLVCGTPPIPPAVRVRQGLHPLLPIPCISLQVFSAKVSDLGSIYRHCTQGSFTYRNASPRLPPLETVWSNQPGLLPYLELRIVPFKEQMPRPSHVQRQFKRGMTGRKFHDSGTKAKKNLGRDIEIWGKATLRLACKMGGRETLAFWYTSFAEDESESYLDRIYSRETTSIEGKLSRQVQRVRRRIEKITALTPPL
jgi:hypothetical protein